jgi:hypothetical protein
MSEHAVVWVRPIGRAVTLHVVGESPRRYFDVAPHVRVSVAGREILAFDPSTDFDQAVRLPGDLLASSDGRVTIDSSKFFVPASAGAADRRHLALRIYGLRVD